MNVRTLAVVSTVATLSSSSALASIRNTFSAPTGDLGANLSTDPTQISRMHGELSYFTTSATATTHALTLTMGGGYKIARNVELVLGLAGEGLVRSAGSSTLDHYAIGNVMLGANYVKAVSYDFRLKLGGALAFGPWNRNGSGLTDEGFVQTITGPATHAYQDYWYYTPNLVHIVVPVRLEYDLGESFVFTGDIQADVGIGLDSQKSGFLFIFAPGFAFWTSDMFSLGLRLPLQFQTGMAEASLVTAAAASDGAQVSLEPYVRFELGETAFLATRFTMNLDEPFGFSFDSGKYWGLHLALGGHF